MSFKANAAEKAALGKTQQIGDTAVARSGESYDTGKGFLSRGNDYVQQGASFLTSLLNGNRANTSALLAPNIQQVREQQAQALQTANTLMPRGGGRSGSLFDSLLAPGRAITSMFTGARTGAVEPLINTGMGMSGQGQGLLGQANSSLGLGGNVQGNILDYEQKNRQMKNQFWSSLGGAAFNLATMPLGGFGGTAAGKLGGLFGGKGAGALNL